MHKSVDKVDEIRIHVGGISKELAENIHDLEQRFSKVGTIVKPFEIHQKSVCDYYFAYITMMLTKSEFGKLKKMWDGVRFKGSKLSVALARDDYQVRWLKDSKRQDAKISERKKRELAAGNRQNRISVRNENPFKLALVTKGRFRRTERKTDLKNLTLRVMINGRLKIIKCKKSKLWGVDKNKKIRDLTYRFIAGEWRDGNDHVVDRFAGKIVTFGDHGIIVESEEENKPAIDEIEQELLDEQSKNNKLLASMLGKYDFNKPVEFDDDMDDETIGEKETAFDYEVEHSTDNTGNRKTGEEKEEDEDEDEDEDEEMTLDYQNVPQTNCIHPSRAAILAEYNSHSQVVKFNEEEDKEETDEDDEYYKNLKPDVENSDTEKEEINSKQSKADESYDDEFIPVFGQSKRSPIVDEVRETTGAEKADAEEENEIIPTFGKSTVTDSKNTTEKLRDLLDSSNISQTVRPIDEISHEPNNELDAVLNYSNRHKNVGLFFSHFDSPFLIAQAQINKLRELNVHEELNYDEWFWNNRGDLNREFRKLRRDVLRRNKKKAKTAVLI